MSTGAAFNRHFKRMLADNALKQFSTEKKDILCANVVVARKMHKSDDQSVVHLVANIRRLAKALAEASEAWSGIQSSPLKSGAESLFPSATLPLLHLVGQLSPVLVEPALGPAIAQLPKDKRRLKSMFEDMLIVCASEIIRMETGEYRDLDLALLVGSIYGVKHDETWETSIPKRRQRLKRDYPAIYRHALGWAQSQFRSASTGARLL